MKIPRTFSRRRIALITLVSLIGMTIIGCKSSQPIEPEPTYEQPVQHMEPAPQPSMPPPPPPIIVWEETRREPAGDPIPVGPGQTVVE